MDDRWIDRKLAYLPAPLRNEIKEKGIVKTYPAGATIIHEGEYVKAIPLVRRGLIKIGYRFDDRDLLLYYIEPGESCVLSFAAMIDETPSQIYAVTEEKTDVILLPSRMMRKWLREYPLLHQMFYHQYNKRYNELLQTIHQLLFTHMDERLLEHLREKARLLNNSELQVSHRQLAEELGTAREVISRVMKKLEQEGQVRQLAQGKIEVL